MIILRRTESLNIFKGHGGHPQAEQRRAGAAAPLGGVAADGGQRAPAQLHAAPADPPAPVHGRRARAAG